METKKESYTGLHPQKPLTPLISYETSLLIWGHPTVSTHTSVVNLPLRFLKTSNFTAFSLIARFQPRRVWGCFFWGRGCSGGCQKQHSLNKFSSGIFTTQEKAARGCVTATKHHQTCSKVLLVWLNMTCYDLVWLWICLVFPFLLTVFYTPWTWWRLLKARASLHQFWRTVTWGRILNQQHVGWDWNITPYNGASNDVLMCFFSNCFDGTHNFFCCISDSVGKGMSFSEESQDFSRQLPDFTCVSWA